MAILYFLHGRAKLHLRLFSFCMLVLDLWYDGVGEYSNDQHDMCLTIEYYCLPSSHTDDNGNACIESHALIVQESEILSVSISFAFFS